MKKKPVYVNLGCGSHIMEEKGTNWVNIDNFELSNNKSFLKADVRDLPLESNSVDYIIMDQVLEHMAMADVSIALYNIRRVLKKGGRCVILVPDFEGAATQWLEANLNAAFDPIKYHWFSEVIYGNQVTEGEFHRTPMSPSYLHYMLNMVGLPKHTISFWPTNGLVPKYPGMRPYKESARLRNAQLVVDLVKE